MEITRLALCEQNQILSGEFPSSNLEAWHRFGITEEFLELQLSNNLFQNSEVEFGPEL